MWKSLLLLLALVGLGALATMQLRAPAANEPEAQGDKVTAPLPLLPPAPPIGRGLIRRAGPTRPHSIALP